MQEVHDCQYLEEFKKEAKQLLHKNNPIVVSEKLIKI
jgi:hypothetical protein